VCSVCGGFVTVSVALLKKKTQQQLNAKLKVVDRQLEKQQPRQ